MSESAHGQSAEPRTNTLEELAEEIVKTLQNQGYEYLPGFDVEDLEHNLKWQLERLNSQWIKGFRFSTNEWNRFFNEQIIGVNGQGIDVKNRKIHGRGNIVSLNRDDGGAVNICLFNREEEHSNYMQVVRWGRRSKEVHQRDVTILINGLPMIHIELHRRGVTIEDAFRCQERNQLNNLHRLFEFIQIFIISNGSNTQYFSNTTSYNQNQNIFLATSRWAHFNNAPINDPIEFVQTFLNARNLLEILNKCCVLDSRGELRILQPHQIAAVKTILRTINRSIERNLSPWQSGGYIWHYDHCDQSLTSFKAAQLSLEIAGVQKVLVLVDRVERECQISCNYYSYLKEDEEDGVPIYVPYNAENLRYWLGSPGKQIIVTTTQKLKLLLKQKGGLSSRWLPKERVVILMDECHRSQKLDIHKFISVAFNQRNVFGFTGTPVWEEFRNHSEWSSATDNIFGCALHKYCLLDAINDGKALKFRIDYLAPKGGQPKQFHSGDPQRIAGIVRYIIRNFGKTASFPSEGDKEGGPKRFNSIMVTETIDVAIQYYNEFRRQLKETDQDIKVAIIFSDPQDYDNCSDVPKDWELPYDPRSEFLEWVMKSCTWCERKNLQTFEDYRRTIIDGMRNGDIDILIVTNMFLEGLDAPRLNTLWLDRKLRGHALMQVMSLTNRVWDRTKTCGNIFCFRDIRKEVYEAITMFSGAQTNVPQNCDERAKEFIDLGAFLQREFTPGESIRGWSKKMKFVKLYKKYHQLGQELIEDSGFQNLCDQWMEELQDYTCMYRTIHKEVMQFMAEDLDNKSPET